MLRWTIFCFLLALVVTTGAAGQGPTGRWEGHSQIPGRALPLVVDLAQDGASAWVGSIIIPGLGIKGAPLSNIVVTNSNVTFELANALGSPPAAFNATRAGDAMAGEMRQAGNVAKFSLAKVGPPQVESPPRSTVVAQELESPWAGEFELGGYPRQVTMTLENHAGAGATAKLVIVGKQTNDLPIDLVIQADNLLRVESSATQVAFEGRIDIGRREIKGTLELGPLELTLTLRRRAGTAS